MLFDGLGNEAVWQCGTELFGGLKGGGEYLPAGVVDSAGRTSLILSGTAGYPAVGCFELGLVSRVSPTAIKTCILPSLLWNYRPGSKQNMISRRQFRGVVEEARRIRLHKAGSYRLAVPRMISEAPMLYPLSRRLPAPSASIWTIDMASRASLLRFIGVIFLWNLCLYAP